MCRQHDMTDWEKLTKDEKHFISHILAFFKGTRQKLGLSLKKYAIIRPRVRKQAKSALASNGRKINIHFSRPNERRSAEYASRGRLAPLGSHFHG